jgi:hypothetical protein
MKEAGVMLHRSKSKLKRVFRSTFLFPLVKPRKAHLYCTGTAKSGTHSIEMMFGNLRSAHQPESDTVIDMIFDLASGRVDAAELGRYLLERDRRLWLDVDSSHLNFFLLGKLVKLFPEAKFILTIRNPYSWLDSFINHELAYEASDRWLKLRDFRFRPDIYIHRQEEMILKEKGLYTLDGYLSYWRHHNHTVIHTVPEERLLVVRTDQITDRAEKIAAFAGVSSRDIRREKTHAFKARAKFGLLEKIDQDYLEYKVKEHCGDLLAHFFPEIQSKKDALTAPSKSGGDSYRSGT